MQPIQPEFSRVVEAADLARETEFDIEATPEERAALAERFDLISLDSLTATVVLKPAKGGVSLTGRLSADVVQACVITLEPVASHVAESFEMAYAPEGAVPEPGDEVEIAAEGEETPERMVGGRIDIGEAVAEHLALALDPFPRKPGVTVEEYFPNYAAQRHDDEERQGSEANNPFAVLASLKKKRQ